MVRELISTVLFISGAALIMVGTIVLSPTAAVIVAGAGLIATARGILIEDNSP